MKWLLWLLLPRSLVGRVFMLYTVTLGGFVLAGLGMFYHYQLVVQLEHEQTLADSLGRIIAPTILDNAVIGDYDTILRTLQSAVEHSDLDSARFIDLTGSVVAAPRDTPPDTPPPAWLRHQVAARLYDNNTAIRVGGKDYGVLRLSFDAQAIAGRLWEQMRFALMLGIIAIGGGLALIRYPLVRWLGNLSRIHSLEQAVQSGDASQALRAAEDAPSEFRETFAVLGRAAASLQAQRVQAAVTLGSIADGVFTLNAQKQVVLANPAACDILGLAAHSVLGEAASSLLPGLMPAADDIPLPSWTCHRYTLHHAQEQRTVVLDTTLSQICAPNGEVAGYVLACRDVSEQHALDQRLRTELALGESAMVSLRTVLEGLSNETASHITADTDDLAAISTMISALVERLRTRNEQLNAIFALSPDGFVSFDTQGRANYVSPGFLHLTGSSKPQVLGASEADIEVLLRRQCSHTLPWRSFEVLRHDLQQHSEQGRTPRNDRIELLRPARRVLEIGLHASASDVISQVLSLRDVTHESEVEQMKSEFLSTAAHELRTPMTSIFGFMELMQMRPMTPQQYQPLLATMHRQANLMIAILNELLDLSRIEARRGKDFVLETLDLRQWAAELLHSFKPPDGRAQATLAPDTEPVWVLVDRNKMSQAVLNVLSNAYKYSPNGGDVLVRIVHQHDASPAMVGIEVQDHGIGLTPEQLARVSERFYRADASGNIPGTGLGMSIMKEIIELLGGHFVLRSEPQVGTTVTLWLPQSAAPS
ncbi:ATP-binding protein [Giesbergeria anulus]|uniref:histidine kinase n=1 Tax=Giesbergeria anulus TaxID=180197 RepID=A0A1H9EIE8_9BURK|nr:ATP-binding protein [Giesbergeria anulus]SEQ25451.1 PAS domain S-box-containing protein [Giesbergeria anulus]